MYLELIYNDQIVDINKNSVSEFEIVQWRIAQFQIHLRQTMQQLHMK